MPRHFSPCGIVLDAIEATPAGRLELVLKIADTGIASKAIKSPKCSAFSLSCTVAMCEEEGWALDWRFRAA